jgi:thiol:disulfide interchange protein DsbA
MKKAFLILFLFPLLAFGQAQPVPQPSFQAGADYLVLPPNSSTGSLLNKNKVTVVEFFSYGCPACFKLEPQLEQWLLHKPQDVVFERIPVVFESSWEVYARTYYITKELKLENKFSPTIFNAIHNDNLTLNSKDAMASFLNSSEVAKKTYLNLYNSPAIDMQLSKDKKIINDYMIFQIPGIVVDGKYKLDPSLSGGNYPRLIDTLNYLINLEKHSNSKATPQVVAGQKDALEHTG